jgi:hypothetical protein
MKQDEVKALSDTELAQVISWAQSEIKVRTERRRQETIAKIKEPAGTVGVTVTIGGAKGRPVRVKASSNK